MSRLGGRRQGPLARRPPRCGFSSARAIGAAHRPMSITTLSKATPTLDILAFSFRSSHVNALLILHDIDTHRVEGMTARASGGPSDSHRHSLCHACVSLLRQPDILKAPIHPVAGLGLIVAYLGRAHLQPCRSTAPGCARPSPRRVYPSPSPVGCASVHPSPALAARRAYRPRDR